MNVLHESQKQEFSATPSRAPKNKAERRFAGRFDNNSTQRSGKPLDADMRCSMESLFHHDFGNVRVHAGADATEASRALNTRAFAAGEDIVLADHGLAQGRRLMAHELAHVVQQRQGGGGGDVEGRAAAAAEDACAGKAVTSQALGGAPAGVYAEDGEVNKDAIRKAILQYLANSNRLQFNLPQELQQSPLLPPFALGLPPIPDVPFIPPLQQPGKDPLQKGGGQDSPMGVPLGGNWSLGFSGSMPDYRTPSMIYDEDLMKSLLGQQDDKSDFDKIDKGAVLKTLFGSLGLGDKLGVGKTSGPSYQLDLIGNMSIEDEKIKDWLLGLSLTGRF